MHSLISSVDISLYCNLSNPCAVHLILPEAHICFILSIFILYSFFITITINARVSAYTISPYERLFAGALHSANTNLTAREMAVPKITPQQSRRTSPNEGPLFIYAYLPFLPFWGRHMFIFFTKNWHWLNSHFYAQNFTSLHLFDTL